MFDLDLSQLPVGGTFVLHGKVHTITSVTSKGIRVEVDGKVNFYSPFVKKWGQFCRDVEGLVIASFHGVDCGCLEVLKSQLEERII